jgi:hypothetical protein
MQCHKAIGIEVPANPGAIEPCDSFDDTFGIPFRLHAVRLQS